jgi:ceramide glucosyltransferase
LEEIGGFEALANHLAEDYEMGRRILDSGKKGILLPHCVETMVDLKSPSQWWHHQIRWDQTIRIIQPIGFLSTILVRSVPFAFLFALTGLGSMTALAVLGAALLIRMGTAAGILKWGLRDPEGLKALPLLPFRDLAGMAFWVLAFMRRKTVWRGTEFAVTLDGRLLAQDLG